MNNREDQVLVESHGASQSSSIIWEELLKEKDDLVSKIKHKEQECELLSTQLSWASKSEVPSHVSMLIAARSECKQELRNLRSELDGFDGYEIESLDYKDMQLHEVLDNITDSKIKDYTISGSILLMVVTLSVIVISNSKKLLSIISKIVLMYGVKKANLNKKEVDLTKEVWREENDTKTEQ